MDPSVKLSVNLAPKNPRGLLIENPVMIASGTLGSDGYGSTLPAELELHRLGAIVMKTITPNPREGNAEPRRWPRPPRDARWEPSPFYLNSIGMENPGLDAILPEIPHWVQRWGTRLIISIAAESPSDLGWMADQLDGIPGISGLELNLSCPNTDQGAAFSHQHWLTARAVRTVRLRTSLPVIAKLSPNVPDIGEIARAAQEYGADALTIANTIPAMRIRRGTGTPVLGNITGGMSGPGLLPINLQLVHQAQQVVGIPIIGSGGVGNAQDALQYLRAGADAVQVGSANLADPLAALRVLDGLIEVHGQEIYGTPDSLDAPDPDSPISPYL